MSYHTKIGMTPFMIVYGREPPQTAKYVSNDKDLFSVQELLIERDRVSHKLKNLTFIGLNKT